MALTTQQRAALLVAVKADATAGPLRTAGDAYSLLAWCNAPSATLAWRVAVPPQDSDEAATYTTFDALLAGKRDSWRIFLMFNRDFSKLKIRNWIADVWGTVIASSISEAILQAGTEFATNAQAAIGGTAKTTGTVTALGRTFTAAVTDAEVSWMIAQP